MKNYKIFLRYLPVILSIPFLIFFYTTNFQKVGKFPAEFASANFVSSDSALLDQLCINSNNYSDLNESISKNAPQIKLNKNLNNNEIAQLDAAHSLYFSHTKNTIEAIDKISEHDLNFLENLIEAEKVTSEDVYKLKFDAKLYFSYCAPDSTNRDFTEAYWAAKGTFTAHHWAHLYEATVQDGKSSKAQYGYFVPYAAKITLDFFEAQGPLNFIRLCWFIFFIVSALYLIIFNNLFNNQPRWLVGFMLLFKIHMFSKLGTFSILLAPGYHWTRELVIVAIPFLVALLINSKANTQKKENILLKSLFIFFPVLLLIDPIFFCFSVLSLGLAYFLINAQRFLFLIKSHPKFNALLLGALLLFICFIIFFGFNNIVYALNKLIYGDYHLIQKRTKDFITVNALVVLAFVTIIACTVAKRNILTIYFSFITCIAALYYYITPDRFHFFKFIEYSTPFLTLSLIHLITILKKFISFQVKLIHAPEFRLNNPAKIIFIGFVLMRVVSDFQYKNQELPVDWIEYSTEKEFIINKRIMRANLSEFAASHLSAFPIGQKFDILISPFDKYLIFLYDTHNGSPSPDFIAWLDSTAKLQTMIASANSGSNKIVMIDESLFELNSLQGFFSDHQIMGPAAYASKLSVKARLRAMDYANHVSSNCQAINTSVDSDWKLYDCSRKGV